MVDRRTLVICGTVVSGLAGVIGFSALLWKWLKYRNCHKRDESEWTEEMLDEWVAYHYCPSNEYVPFNCVPKEAMDFPLKCAQLCIRHKSVIN